PTNAVVVVDLPSVIVVVLGHVCIARSLFELLLLEGYHVAVETGVVLQHAPRERVAIRAYAEKATELKRGIAHLTRDFVDDYVVDRAELVAVCVVDGGSRDLRRRNTWITHGKDLLEMGERAACHPRNHVTARL